MYKIAIIEDNKEELSNLLKQIEKYQEEKNVIFDVKTFENAYYFIHDYKNDFHIVFMDIDLPGVNGMDTAKKLRELDHNVSLVFVTNLAQYAIKGYEVEAYDFILKPATYARLSSLLDKLLINIDSKAPKSINIKTTTGYTRLNLDEIIYVAVEDHLLYYHTQAKNYECWDTLKNVSTMLEAPRFTRISKSIILNLSYVKSLEGDTLILLNDEKVVIAHKLRNEILSALNQYMAL